VNGREMKTLPCLVIWQCFKPGEARPLYIVADFKRKARSGLNAIVAYFV